LIKFDKRDYVSENTEIQHNKPLTQNVALEDA